MGLSLVQRLLLNTSGLKISLPGVAVGGAGSRQLAFDSNATMKQVFLRGQVIMPVDTFDVTVYYGKTFPLPPTGYVFKVRDGSSVEVPFFFYNLMNPGRPMFTMTAYIDRLRIRRVTPTTIATFNYMILDND